MTGKVYFVKLAPRDDINYTAKKARHLLSQSRLLEIFEKGSLLGIKTHFGENSKRGIVRPECIKAVVNLLRPVSGNRIAVIETNTLYAGHRSNTPEHLAHAHRQGFSASSTGAPIVIADGLLGRYHADVEISKEYFKSVKIAADVAHMDGLVVLSHATGHCQVGFAGAIKNLGMGCAAKQGKLEQHSEVIPEIRAAKCTGCGTCIRWCPAGAITLKDKKAVIDKAGCIGCGECIAVCKSGAPKIFWDENTMGIQKKLAEYAFGAMKCVNKKAVFVNFLNNITRDCDCMCGPEDGDITPGVGIAASRDPVALDTASCELILKSAGEDIFRKNYPQIDWNVQLEHAQKIGLGSMKYDLEEIVYEG
ncbi:MAG: DUF362 domain-containing protein [Candidatus Omnitrophota bacterium]